MSGDPRRPAPMNREMDQLKKDVLLNIMRDWAYHAAGIRSPWTSQYKCLKRSHRLAGYCTEGLPPEIEEEWQGPMPTMIDVLMLSLRVPDNMIDDPVAGVGEFLSMHPFERLSLINRTLYESDSLARLPIASTPRKPRESGRVRTKLGIQPSPPGQTLGLPANCSESVHGIATKARVRYSSKIISSTQSFPSSPTRSLTRQQHRPTSHPSRLSLNYRHRSPFVLFLSQLIPKSFDASKRAVALSLLQQHIIPQIPSCIVSGHGQYQTMFFGTFYDNWHRLRNSDLDEELVSAMPDPVSPERVSSTINSEPGPSGRGWVPSSLPVEVYTTLAKHLARDDLSNMRLVCCEFERCLSASLFRSAVVPFRSAIFGMVLASQQPGRNMRADNSHSCDLYSRDCKPSDVDMGMRVFQGWGPYIQKFALAFEVNEESLSKPPTKLAFELHESFWGTYSWPHMQYNWFAVTAAQERTADKKYQMTKALSYLRITRELGLSLDSGLGWMNGPDISDRAIIFSEPSSIFGTQNKLPDRVTVEKQKMWEAICDSDQPWYYTLYQNYPNPDPTFLARYMELLFETGLLNEANLKFLLDFMAKNPVGSLRFRVPREIEDSMNRRAVLLGWNRSDGKAVRHGIESLIRRGRGQSQGHEAAQLGRLLEFASIPRPALEHLGIIVDDSEDEEFMDDTDMMGDEEDDLLFRVEAESEDDATDDPLADDSEDGSQQITSPAQPPRPVQPGPPLIFGGVNYDLESYAGGTLDLIDPMWKMNKISPYSYELRIENLNDLSDAQKQWLMETEYAQRAFLSSYILAVIDNHSTFTKILTLNLAKISSRYLLYFDRPDFWDALPNVKNLTIMVSPDWREISKSSYENITLEATPILKAVEQLIIVLESRIVQRESIKTLKLGYMGGGEHATGLFARNQHILPAPIYKNSTTSMHGGVGSDPRYPARIVLFPYVEELTFVNCWVVPRILVAFVMLMKKHSLRKLKLDSVSIPVHAGARSADATIFTPPRAASKMEAGNIPRDLEDFGLPRSTALRPVNPRVRIPLGRSPSPTTDPAKLNDYLSTPPEATSWVQLIDDITSGRTIDVAGQGGDPMDFTCEGSTDSIQEVEFNSCGYVKLGRQDMRTDLISPFKRNAMLLDRLECLRTYMLSPTQTDRPYLGQVVPAMSSHEQDYLIHAFGMRMGWGDDPKRLHNREDNQRMGGLGRFSGSVTRG